jgi:outer membrane lipoprotein-sorting protein
MKITIAFLLISFAAAGVFADDIKSGQDLIAAMHKRYDSKWYKTLTFKQVTTNYKPDGTSEASIWYEALRAPGSLRIDFEPLDKHDGILFTGGKLYSFQGGKLAGTRDFVHPLLVLGFDVYVQPVDVTLAQIKAMNIDLSAIHQETWQGKTVYVVGAKQGDLTTPQFWVDKKDLLFVRLFQPAGKDKKSVAETRFNKYVRSGGGWVAAEVQFFVDGKAKTTEEYSDIKTGQKLDVDLWNSEKWFTVDRQYIRKG